ncbi:MAG: DUF1275 domain-containing protein [Atopobiaceae bacterium]|nr:DUF1275 domain-containing protein [Atopobiaceae bacterium]
MANVAQREAAWERTALGLAVICAGGLMDAYSYLTRGNVFATGQTGNVVLLGLHLAQLDWLGVGHYLAPIVAFVCGILLSKHIKATVHDGVHVRMQRWVIAFEAVAFALIALVPASAPDLLVNSLISLCAAVSFENFRTFGTRSAYASIFCTGNLRSFAETLYDGLVGGDRQEVERSLRYLALVASFACGVVLGFFLVGTFAHWAALGVSALFVLASRFVGE